MDRVEVSYISDSKVEHHGVEDLPELLCRDDGVLSDGRARLR
jgi:hypothetical protein